MRPYYAQPIALRHPIVFYEGPTCPGSASTRSSRKASNGRASTRGSKPCSRAGSIRTRRRPGRRPANRAGWPERTAVHRFADEADRQVVEALLRADVEQPGHPLLDRAEAVFTILEHESMHQETLLYMWHRLPFAQKRKPSGYEPRTGGSSPRIDWVEIPGGCATLGVGPGSIAFAWDNERPALSLEGPGVFDRTSRRDQRAVPRIRRGGRVSGRAPLATARLAVDSA